MNKRLGVALAGAALFLVPPPAQAVVPSPACVATATVNCTFSCLAGTQLQVTVVNAYATRQGAHVFGAAYCGEAEASCHAGPFPAACADIAGPVAYTSLTGQCVGGVFAVVTCTALPGT